MLRGFIYGLILCIAAAATAAILNPLPTEAPSDPTAVADPGATPIQAAPAAPTGTAAGTGAAAD